MTVKTPLPWKQNFERPGQLPAHRTIEGHSYGWEVEPTADSWRWGMRVVAPCKDSAGEVKSMFTLMPVSETVVRRYTDFESRYDHHAAVQDALYRAGKGWPRWFRVRIREKPLAPDLRSLDPFTTLVHSAFAQWERHGLKPMIRYEDLLVLAWTDGKVGQA